MEQEVFDAVTNGSLHRLKVLLKFKPKEVVAELVSSITDETTPLVVASVHGDSRIALYLIKNCHADVEQVGCIIFYGKRVYGATPLFSAVAGCHLHLVKILLKYKAFVNCATREKMTPLYAACLIGHLEIVRYLMEHGADIEFVNAYNYTCLIIASYKGHYEVAKYLVECGADVNKKTLKGHTALHGCAESGNLDIVKLLLENGAKFESDSNGVTPLMTAASKGHAHICDYFAHNISFTKYDIINALELMGAAFMYIEGFMNLGLSSWLRAMHLRYEDKENPFNKPTVQALISSYVDATEILTVSQLEEIKSDSEELKKQALLVCERILGPGHPYTHTYIMHCASVYAERDNFDRCIELWMYVLDAQLRIQETHSDFTISSFLFLVEKIFGIMSSTWPFARRLPAVLFYDNLKVFERILKQVEKTLQSSQKQLLDLNVSYEFQRLIVIGMHLIVQMCQLQPRLDRNGDLLLKKYVHQFVQMNFRYKNGWTPLHFACFEQTSTLFDHSVCSFPSSEVIDLLLEVGASPNAMDLNNNTPLHIAAMNESCEIAVFKSLLKHGAHLDICNFAKETPLQLIKIKHNHIDLYPLQHINLQCLCAQVVKSNEISYKGFVHKTLEEFIDFH